MKDAYYFPHDSNAKDDPKCIMLIEELGLEGYGIFWVLIETLRDQPGYHADLKILPGLARRYNTSLEKMKSVIVRYNLFGIEDDQFFFSESLKNRMNVLDDRREKARRAGIMSGKARAKQLNGSSTDVQRTFNERSTTVEPVKESIVKDSKLNHSKGEDKKEAAKTKVLPYVHLYDNEIESLIEKEGQHVYDWCVQKLSAYKGQTGKKYKSDYSAILNWVIKAYYKHQTELNDGKTLSVTEALRNI
jgi:hypothetical protein